MMKRWLRGSSSRGSKETENEEKKKPKYNLSRTTEVRPCEWPSDAYWERTRSPVPEPETSPDPYEESV
jgi:hypothetical protein